MQCFINDPDTSFAFRRVAITPPDGFADSRRMEEDSAAPHAEASQTCEALVHAGKEQFDVLIRHGSARMARGAKTRPRNDRGQSVPWRGAKGKGRPVTGSPRP